MQAKDCSLFQNGRFFVGVNYWASNAGTNMWHDWDENVIKRDLDILQENNIKVLRCFPLWSDFQPIETLYGGCHERKYIAFGEKPMPDTKEAKAGIDPVMAERFGRFLDLAQERGIEVIIGLITGWMSGRLFVPHALEGLNIQSDPTSLKWQIKFVKYMVNRFKYHSAIAAWELGNETNCMEINNNPDLAYTWSAIIADAIRSEDNTRIIISGMHGLDPNSTWRPQDQGEITDVLCTHPYPAFTEYCDTDPIDRMKSGLHAAAQSVYYRGVGGKPCFAEEINTLGPMFGDENTTAANADMALFNLFAHNCFGYMWWCANDQSNLHFAPYDWCNLERQLGLIKDDGTHIKTLERMTEFSKLTDRMERPLPERVCDAVCILVPKQDCFAAAYGSFLLAKQAGLDIEFAYSDEPIPESDAYMLPSQALFVEPGRNKFDELMRRVENGATLYISCDGANIDHMAQVTGLEIISRRRRIADSKITLCGDNLTVKSKFVLKLRALTAEVIASDTEGNPVFTVNNYGKGKVYFIDGNIEYTTAKEPAVIDGERLNSLYRVYETLGIKSGKKIVTKSSPYIGVTEHIIDEDNRYVLVCNYEPQATVQEIKIPGYSLVSFDSVGNESTISGKKDSLSLSLPANGGVIIRLTKAL